MKKAYLVISKTNQGASFRLIKDAVDEASEGKKVLFITTELNVCHITERIYGYVNGTEINSEILDITVRQAKDLNFMESDEKFDVVIIDSPYLLFQWEPMVYPYPPYEKIFDIIGEALLIMNVQVSRNNYENGCFQVLGFHLFPKWVIRATYLEKIDMVYVETSIDLLTCTKNDDASVFILKKAPMTEIPYLTKIV